MHSQELIETLPLQGPRNMCMLHACESGNKLYLAQDLEMVCKFIGCKSYSTEWGSIANALKLGLKKDFDNGVTCFFQTELTDVLFARRYTHCLQL